MACDSLYFLPSEIARLVLGYLQSEGYSKTYKNFVKECPHLSEYVSFMKKGQYYPLTINGLALMQILEEYGALRVAETSRKLTPNPALSSLWCQFDSVVDNIKKRVASNSSLVYKGNEKQQSRTRMQMVERRRNQIKATITNADPDIIQPHNSKTTIAPLVVTQDKTDSDYSLSQPASPSDGGHDDNYSDEMSVDDPVETVMELPTSQPTQDISSYDLGHNKTLPSPRSVIKASGSTYQNSSEKCNVSECSTTKSQTELTDTEVPVASFKPTMTCSTESGIHVDTEMTDAPGSPSRSVALVPSLKTPVKHHTTQEPLLEKSPRRKRPPKRKPQGEQRKQNKSDSGVVQGIGSHNESSNSTDGSALENSFPQILEHIMNDPLLPHKLAENINKSLHPEVIPDPGTPAALPSVDVVPESPFMGRSLEDILDQQETQMPASSINGIIELTEKDPNFEWLFSAGVCYLDEVTHDRDFTDHKGRSNGLQSSARNTTQQPQPGSSGCRVDTVPASSMSFDVVPSDNIHFTPPTSFMPISDDTENNLFKISMQNFSNPPTSNDESFHNLPEYTTVSGTGFPVTDSVPLLNQPVTSSIPVLLPVTTSYSASRTSATSSIQSVTVCVTAQPLETAVTSHQPITSKISSKPITTAVTSIQPITSSFSSESVKETVESTLTSPHGFPVLSLRSSVNDDDLPDPLSSFTIQSPVKPCVTSQCCTNEGKGSVASATYSSFVSGMGEGQHSSTPITARSNSLVLPCMTGISSSAEFTQYSSVAPTSSQMVFAKPHSTVPTVSPKSLPTVNLKSLLDKLEAKAKGEIVEIDLPTKPPAKPSNKCRGRKKNHPPKKTSPKRVEPKPLNPSAGANWSSELSALVKITSPEKSTPHVIQRSNIKKTRVTTSNDAHMSDMNSNQTVPQTRAKKTNKGNETVMAVLSPNGSCVHHVPVLEVNSLSEVADAKDLVPMGQLVPTSLPVVTSSPVTMATTQTSMTSQLVTLSSQSHSFLSVPLSSPPPETSSLQTECSSSVVMTSTCLPFVQTDAPQTPPTTSCHTEYPSMPDLCGTQPSLPVPATTCDRPKDTQLDHATVLGDAYSADRDFLESPCSDIGTGDGSTPSDNLIETCATSINEDLNRYCGIPINKLTQRDIHVRPLDFSSQVPQTSPTEVSSPIRQPSFGRGKRTPATNKKKIGRPPQRRSTRGKSQSITDDNISSPTTSKDVKNGPPQNDMTPRRTGSSLEKFESSAGSLECHASQQVSDSPLRNKASQDNSTTTPSHKVKKALAVTPHQGRSLYDESVSTPHQDFEYSLAGTPNQLTICTPTRTDDIPTKGDASQRQVLTLGNVGALSLQEVVNSPSLHEDITSRDSVLSLQVLSPSLHNSEQNSHKKPAELTTDISDLKLKDHYSNVDIERQKEIRNSHSVAENENIVESEVNTAVLSIQDNTTCIEICKSSSVTIMENKNMNVIGMDPRSPIPDTQGKMYNSSQDTLKQLSYSGDQRSEEVVNTDNRQSSTPTEVKDNSHWSASKDTFLDQQSDINVQSVTTSQSKQTVVQSEMTQNRTHSDSSFSQSVNSNLNTCTASNTTTNNHAHLINPTEAHDTQQPEGNINPSQGYQNVSPSTITSANILEDAMLQVFSASDSQQTFFSPNPVLTDSQVIESSTANKEPTSCKGPTSQMLSSSTPVVSQTQFIVYSPLPTQTVLSSTPPTTMIHSAAPVLTHSKFVVKSSAPVVTPATFIVTSPTYPVVVNSPAPLASHSQFVINSPLMVKSPATPLIVNSPTTPQVVHSPAAVLATAPYKSVCSPAQHKVSSRAPTPQMEPADFIPDRSGTIYVTPNVLAQMSCEKGLVVQQERAATTSSIEPCPSDRSAVDKCGVTGRPDVGQSPRGQYQSDQDIFAETTDEEVAEPSQVLPTQSEVAAITEVSHDIAKIPSLFDTKDGHNQVTTQAENASPHCSKDRHSPRYFSALSNSNDTPVCDPTSTMEAYPNSPNSGEVNLQKDPCHSALPETTNHVSQQSDSEEDIDILGDWDPDLSAEEINTASITEHTISHDSSPLSSDSCSPSKRSAWQAGFATKPSSTTSAFIRKILEQKNTRQTSEKKSPSCTEKVSLKTQTTSQKSPVLHTKNSVFTQSNADTKSAQNRPVSSDQHSKERTPRRMQVITLSKEVSKVSKDSQNAVQSARGPFKHPQELTPRKTSHMSGKIASHAKHSISSEKTSRGEHSAEKDVSSHQQYVTPPKKRFTASLKSGDGLYFVSETQGSQSTDNHSHQTESHNFQSKSSQK
ncbi:flocculation protein FLO11-like [Pecten maximus]|uniref:flocculation protein FLO11-like n=1 Tax=Pecten maximus TaxID=6579 RepID=UPI0014582B85|nr:flocculation protein FLO11-like [Pecten maximus]